MKNSRIFLPKEAYFKKDKFVIFVYALVAVMVVIQFTMMFGFDFIF